LERCPATIISFFIDYYHRLSAPPLRGGNARGDALYIPHIPSEARTLILSVDIEEA
jgi:hypothetical protein